MKRHLIITIILLIAAVFVTVIYFENLSPPGQRTSRIMHTIPGNTAIIFEFNNDKGFYDIFNSNQLFSSVIGKQSVSELDILRQQLLLNPALEPYFTGQNIFISLHPLNDKNIDILVTTSASNRFKLSVIDQLAKQKNNGLLITPVTIEGKKGYTIYSNILKKRFYLVNTEDDIFSGSFSKDLLVQSIRFKPQKDKTDFVLLPDQQNSNSLANLYINYSQLNALFNLLFTNKNTDIFKSFRLFPGLAALSLNFKNDALMFSGLTNMQKNEPESYLSLFINQQPVVNQLKDIFPSTTAYSINFSVSDPARFKSDLSQWQAKEGLQQEKDSLFRKIKAETGINLIAEFNQLLGSEFAIVTTRYQEKFAIIALKDGSKLRPVINNISTIITANTGQFNYNKLPFFLLGDAFNIFKRPYFMIIDNYLVLATSTNELASYYDTYFNRKFLSKIEVYNQFDNSLSARSNVAWFINFKNSQSILKRDMNTDFYRSFEIDGPGWGSFYSASYQLLSADKQFYTNFRMNLSDTTVAQNQFNK
jgi:hypothetical protein